MRFSQKTLRIFKFFVGFILINFLLACSGVNPLSPGAWVEEKDRIPVLETGPHEGGWETRDLTIEYEIQQLDNTIRITGVVKMGGRMTPGFTILDHLTIYIHALGPNGIVRQTKAVKTFGFRRQLWMMGTLSFDGEFELSTDSDIIAVAFSYSGTVQSGGDDAGMDFWKVPRRKPPEQN